MTRYFICAGSIIPLAIIGLLQSFIQTILLWFYAPSRPHYGHKRQQPADQHNHLYSKHKPDWLKAEIIRLTGMASVTPGNETCHARFPLLNPLPQAGEEANESLREFHVAATMPQAGCRSIADICNRRFAASRKITVGKTYVHQVLQQHYYEIQVLRQKLKHAKPKKVPRNLIWGIDLTGKTDTNGKLHSLFGNLDHGSRALLYLQALHDKTSHTLIACIGEVIRTYGKPKIIRTDNEPIFTSRIFRRGLKLLGIRHQLTDPGCPWQNGRIERLFGTLKQKLDQLTYSPLSLAGEGLGERVGVRAQLNRDLDAFRHWYNHIRPHQNLDGKTPAEAWSGVNPYAKPPKQEYWFEAWDGLLAGYCLRY